MIRKQNLNKNWSDLGSVLIDSLPEILQKDQKEWLGYQWNLVVGKKISEWKDKIENQELKTEKDKNSIYLEPAQHQLKSLPPNGIRVRYGKIL